MNTTIDPNGSFADLLGHIGQRLTGQPAVSLSD
jgi:hypothetical protein